MRDMINQAIFRSSGFFMGRKEGMLTFERTQREHEIQTCL
jgi:hypothetical protein